jgi:RNA polymerase sigma factor (sigma-70 family)
MRKAIQGGTMRGTELGLILNSTYAHHRRDPRTDAELLTCYLEHQDDAAFEVLLIRHTPAVRVTCRGWLRCPADIDDAAQATFLVMVQRARSIRDRAALGHWLCRVAANVARSSRRQQKVAGPLPEELAGRPPGDDGLRDLLAEEVGRLPEKYRMPVQLCYGVGLTTDEAAQRLGWPRGTVLTRLSWARKRLQKNLARHGILAAVPSMLAVSTSVNGQWIRATVFVAKAMRSGQSLLGAGVSERMISIIKGVIRTMIWDKVKYPACAALLAAGLLGFGLAQWASATDGRQSKDPEKAPMAAINSKEQGPQAVLPGGKEPVKPEEAKPQTTARRSEAVIRLPLGTFVKEIEAEPYGDGRVIWTYEDDRVLGSIEGSVMGFEFALATEAEISLSSSGTVYGILTSVRLTQLKVPNGEEYAQVKPFLGLWPVIEPLVNEVCVDMPFSYHCRVQNDRIVISNFRILLAGPNPLGKLGGLAAAEGGNGKEVLAGLAYFQALGVALEGTYRAGDASEKSTPKGQIGVPKTRGGSKQKIILPSPTPPASRG